MKRFRGAVLWAGLIALIPALPLSAQSLRTVSVLDPAQGPPPGGCGDSCAPVMSPDGRYVLFASTASNLLLTTNNAPIPLRLPAVLNVFLRDRMNGTTTLVSANVSGVWGGNGNSLPVEVSTDGRYALFESSASDLVAGDTNNAADVFVRDVMNGTTLLVSVATNGFAGNGGSRGAAMTPDGHRVVFVSGANNLVAGDTNTIADVFVRDLQANTTVLASVRAKAAGGTNYTSSSEAPVITPDGRYVAFYSSATNLVAAAPRGADVYVRDLAGGTTTWASAYARTAVPSNTVVCFNHTLSTNGQWLVYEASGNSSSGPSANLTPATSGTVLRYNLSSGITEVVATNAAVPTTALEDAWSLDMTPDGRFVAFVANANGTSGGTTCVWLWDGNTGGAVLVSGDTNGLVPANSTCDWPWVDPTGRWVAFHSSPSNLTTNAAVGDYHLYLRDTQAGTTTLLDADTNGIGSPVSAATMPRLSADGRLVAFECADAGLVANDRNHDYDVFVRDLATGTSDLISAHEPTLATISANGPSTLATTTVSTDGRFVAFSSEADNLVPNDTNGVRDIFVRDLVNGTTVLVSAATNGVCGDGPSTEPVISGDGRFIAFTSSADNLVVGDTNRAQDVFLRDVEAGTTRLVSADYTGAGPGNGASYAGAVGAGGRFVTFVSKASNLLAAGQGRTFEHVFLRDMQAGTNRVLTEQGGSRAVLTPDGRFVTFWGAIDGAYSSNIYVLDVRSGKRTLTNDLSGPRIAMLSPDGRFFACWIGLYSLVATDMATKTNWTLMSSSSLGSRTPMSFSADAQWLTYGASNLVYLYDLRNRTNALVSHAFSSSMPAAGVSDWPTVSADGRFVAFESGATNLVAGVMNGVPQIFLYDRLTRSNSLLVISQSGGPTPDNCGLTPVFSGDGRTLLFSSWASDLAPNDFNHNGDVVAYTFLQASILPGDPAGQGPWLSWPSMSGKRYKVQFKDALDESGWHDLGGTPTNSGSTAYLQDASPATSKRFYRVVGF